MANVGYASHVGERLRFYCASVLIQFAKSILWLIHRLFLIVIFDIAGVKYGVRDECARLRNGRQAEQRKDQQEGREYPRHMQPLQYAEGWL